MPGPTVLPPAPVGLATGVADRFLPGTGTARPGGVEAVFEYNGVSFNVRSWQDTFLIISIDGLADPDVRDSREVNPGRHGETHFDALYGGRTIVLTGRIRAGNLKKLRDMQAGLKQAFGDISGEKPLYIRTNDPTRDVFINCKKSQPITMAETQGNFNYTRDFQVTLRASDPFFLSYMEQRLAQSYAPLLEEFSTGVEYNGPINLSENPDGASFSGPGPFSGPALGFYARPQLQTGVKYASPTGNDSTGTGTLAAPYATVQKLFNELAPGQTGVLRAGTYTSAGTYVLDVTVGNSGTPVARKKLMNYPGEAVTFSGRHTVRTGAGWVDFEGIKFLGGANTLFEYYGSGSWFDQCEFNNGNSAAQGMLVGSKANGWAVNYLKITRSFFRNIGPAGTGNLHHGMYIDNTVYNAIEGRTVEIHNNIFRECQGGYTIQLYRNPKGVWIHHNVFYNNYRGMIISADNPSDPTGRAENCLIENNIFHTTNAAVSPYGYHFSHYMEPPPAAGNYLGNAFNFNIVWNPAYDPDNNGGIQVDGADTQGFEYHGNQEIDPGFTNPGANNFTTSAPAAAGKGITTVWGDVGPNGTYPKTPMSVTTFGTDARLLSAGTDVELVHLKNDGSRFPCDPGDRVGVRAKLTLSNQAAYLSFAASVSYFDAGGSLLTTNVFATTFSGTGWLSGIAANAPAGAASFSVSFQAIIDPNYALVPNTMIAADKVLIVLNPTGDMVPKFFSGNFGGTWLGTAQQSASQMISEDGLDNYDLYSSYLDDPEASVPNIYAQSGRLRMNQNSSLFRFIRKDAPSAASMAGSIVYVTGANVVRSAGYTAILIKWVNDLNYIYGRVLYTNATAQLQFWKCVAGVHTQMGTTTDLVAALAISTNYKLQAQISGNDLSMTHQKIDGTQVTNKTYTLSALEPSQFGSTVVGKVGFAINHPAASMSDWQWDDHAVEVVAAADVVTLPAINEGNANARPKIRVYGPLNAAVNGGPAVKLTSRFTNDAGTQEAASMQINAQSASVITAIAADRYIEIDSLERTIKEYDEDGEFIRNAYEQLDITSEWLELGPHGTTDFEMQTFSTSRPDMELRYRHTFL